MYSSAYLQPCRNKIDTSVTKCSLSWGAGMIDCKHCNKERELAKHDREQYYFEHSWPWPTHTVLLTTRYWGRVTLSVDALSNFPQKQHWRFVSISMELFIASSDTSWFISNGRMLSVEALFPHILQCTLKTNHTKQGVCFNYKEQLMHTISKTTLKYLWYVLHQQNTCQLVIAGSLLLCILDFVPKSLKEDVQ